MPQLNFRCTDEEKAAWDAIAGENLSGWIKDTLNAEVGRKGGTVAKVSQKRPGRPKKGFLASVPPIPAEVQALVAKMEGSPTDAPNPVFAMLKSKLPSSVKHDPAATQFKTAKPKK